MVLDGEEGKISLAITLGNEKNVQSSDQTELVKQVVGESEVGKEDELSSVQTELVKQVVGESEVGKEDELSSVGEEGEPSSDGAVGLSPEEEKGGFAGAKH